MNEPTRGGDAPAQKSDPKPALLGVTCGAGAALFWALGPGSVIQPSSATLGGLLLAAVFLRERVPFSRVLGAVAIVGGLVVIGAESIGHIGPDGVLGDLLFVLTGFMFAVFGTLLRHWRVNAFSAATVISVLSLS